MPVRTFVGFGALLLLSAGALAQAPAPGQTPPAETVCGPGPGVTNPKLVKEIRPTYPAEAMRDRIQARVLLDVVINADGTVGDVKIIRPLDPRLDAEAVTAAKQWLFKAACRDGKPVPSRATLELSFRVPDEFEHAYKPDTPGLVAPKMRTSVQREYTPEARAAGTQGKVVVEIVVAPNGQVSAARVTQPLDPRLQTIELEGRVLLQEGQGLDDAALRAARQWTFEPATLNGKPVAASTTVEFEFKVR
jgi:TonB family protein